MSVQRGFTTVEVLVTLFVAALFIFSGYQLYGAISLNSGNMREMAEASNIGYDVLRDEGATYQAVTAACSAPATVPVTRANTKVPNLNISIARCKPFSDSNLISVTVIVKYGNPQREVRHATYVAP